MPGVTRDRRSPRPTRLTASGVLTAFAALIDGVYASSGFADLRRRADGRVRTRYGPLGRSTGEPNATTGNNAEHRAHANLRDQRAYVASEGPSTFRPPSTNGVTSARFVGRAAGHRPVPRWPPSGRRARLASVPRWPTPTSYRSASTPTGTSASRGPQATSGSSSTLLAITPLKFEKDSGSREGGSRVHPLCHRLARA